MTTGQAPAPTLFYMYVPGGTKVPQSVILFWIVRNWLAKRNNRTTTSPHNPLYISMTHLAATQYSFRASLRAIMFTYTKPPWHSNYNIMQHHACMWNQIDAFSNNAKYKKTHTQMYHESNIGMCANQCYSKLLNFSPKYGKNPHRHANTYQRQLEVT